VKGDVLWLVVRDLEMECNIHFAFWKAAVLAKVYLRRNAAVAEGVLMRTNSVLDLGMTCGLRISFSMAAVLD
jgi:hypothetical protein